MEVGVLGDEASILMEIAASGGYGGIEIIDCVEVFVGERPRAEPKIRSNS